MGSEGVIERIVRRAGEMVMWFDPRRLRISEMEVREAGMVFVGDLLWER